MQRSQSLASESLKCVVKAVTEANVKVSIRKKKMLARSGLNFNVGNSSGSQNM